MDLPKRFAIFRKEIQLFEILRPHYAKDGTIQRLVYEDPLGIAVWDVCLDPTPLPPTIHSANIKGKSVEYIYTDAVLRAPNYTGSIPIVSFLRNYHFPANIRGIRVNYMDNLGPSYFTKKRVGSKALHITFRGDQTVVVQDLQEEHQPSTNDFHAFFFSFAIIFLVYVIHKRQSHTDPFVDTCPAHPTMFEFMMSAFP
jgi:hypothetical protein